MGLGIFFIMIFCTLLIICLNIVQIKSHPNICIRVICCILFIFTGLRYISLIVFTLGAKISVLKLLSYFYFASSIGITIPSALALWYIIPRFRERIRLWVLFLLLSPFFFFYLILIYLQPLKIIIKPGFGYMLMILQPWSNYFSILQAIFIILVFLGCFLGFKWYQYKSPRSQYLLFALGYGLMFIDGVSVLINKNTPIEPFILSEAFVMVAILYAFSTKPIKERVNTA